MVALPADLFGLMGRTPTSVRTRRRTEHLVAQLLTLAGLPTAGNVGALIPQLAGLEFDARLVLDVDSRSGRTYNALAEIYVDGAP